MVNLTVPGVKIQEVSTLPPSVAPVDTAVPAFVGYTALNGGKVKKIKSFLEFEQYFGGPEPLEVIVTLAGDATTVNGATILVPSPTPHYLLYYSVKSFYDNGGGDCYVASAADYETGFPYVDNVTLKNALALIEKEDEPTLLVIPDAINLSDSLYGDVYQAALTQCGTLKDRFAIIDADPSGEREVATLTLPTFSTATNGDFLVIKNQAGTSFAFWLQKDGGEAPTATEYTNIVAANKVAVPIVTGDDTADEVAAKVLAAVTTLASWPTSGMSLVAGAVTTGTLILTQDNFGTTIDPVPYNADASGVGSITFTVGTSGVNEESISTIRGVLGSNNLKYGAAYFPRLETIYTPSATEASITVKTDSVFATNTLAALIKNNPTITGNTIVNKPLLISQILKIVSEQLSTYPVIIGASGAIAGVYARTDFNIGVWKAPANTSINAIYGTTLQVGDDLQSLLNVDATSGKSINAIRFFSGKGNLVWGARTLAGNDNEWRYINVRRLMIFIEESCQKASSQFVFEPNTAQTWSRMKGMIDNFLTNLWRQGALAGAKPEDAFFVRVGIGTTMSAQDILDGVMNVEIGVAPSRPAEFIVLKFSHKLQVS
jgi:phage tail sheath protein FI